MSPEVEKYYYVIIHNNIQRTRRQGQSDFKVC